MLVLKATISRLKGLWFWGAAAAENHLPVNFHRLKLDFKVRRSFVFLQTKIIISNDENRFSDGEYLLSQCTMWNPVILMILLKTCLK